MAVLFDLDGVLADSGATIAAAMNAAFVARGHGARPAAEIEGIIGPPLPAAIAGLLDLDPASPEVAATVAAYRERYATTLGATRAFPGVAEVVRSLAEPLAVATSKAAAYAGPVLDAIGLADAFAVVAAPTSDAHAGKLGVVRDALARLDEPGRAMVGDRSFDMAAARACGLRAIGVRWGFGSRAELEAAGADVLVATPAELAAELRRR